MTTQAVAGAVPWWKDITRDQWRALAAAKLGWMLDAMDFLLYVMAIGQLRAWFGFDDSIAGLLGTVTLVTSAVGGIVFGIVADRAGRTRALMATIIIFSVCSLGAATSQTLWQLMLWRIVLGFGMGGEWASGAVLVSETWPAHLRVRAIGIMQSGWALGYIAAALLAALVLGRMNLGPQAWRWLFAIGVLPALLTLWIRRKVKEPDAWRNRNSPGPRPHAPGPRRNAFAVLFGTEFRKKTVLATLLSACVQFANWGLFFWLPGFLARPVEHGGAGMSIVRSAGWIIPVQIGAYIGYNSFGFIAEKMGRRRTFVAYLVTAAILVPLYGQLGRSPGILMALGPLLGFVGYGYFSLFGSFLAELFPTDIRATGQGLTYNLGRGLGALAPYTIGYVATLPNVGIGSALALTSAFFLAGAGLIMFFADNSKTELAAAP
jgi:MFS family permease